MKFHQLTLSNIKNLRGVFHLDFDMRFGSEELFLIFGEMGTGKTTLFDGISLALYGKTPQLSESYTSQKNNSIRYILNTESERCFASLVFSLSGEKIYRATWFFRNMHKNAKASAPKRTLELLHKDFSVAQVLCSTTNVGLADKEFANVLCNLSFADFVRGVFLPQNQFNRFITESTKERTNILERITNTEIYAQIEKKVDELYKEVQAQVRQKRADVSGFPTTQEAAALQLRKEDLLKQQRFLSILRLACQKSGIWLQGQKEEKERKKHLDILSQQLNEYLELSKTAQQKLTEQKISSQEAQKRQDKHLALIANHEQDFVLYKELRSQETYARQLLTQSTQQEHILNKRLETLPKSNIPSREMISNVEENRNAARKHLMSFIGEILDHDGVPDVRLQEDVLDRYQNRLLFIEERLHHIKELKKIIADTGAANADILRFQEAFDTIHIQREHTLFDIQQKKERLEEEKKESTSTHTDIRFYQLRLQPQQLREGLIDGEPCIVCGSKEHPLQGIAHPEEEEFHKRLAELQQRYTQLCASVANLEKELRRQETEQARLEERIKNGREKIAEKKALVLRLEQNQKQHRNTLEIEGNLDLVVMQTNAENLKINMKAAYQEFVELDTECKKLLLQQQQGQEQEVTRQQLCAQLAEEKEKKITREEIWKQKKNQLQQCERDLCSVFSLANESEIDTVCTEQKYRLEHIYQQALAQEKLNDQQFQSYEKRVRELQEEHTKKLEDRQRIQSQYLPCSVELDSLFDVIRNGPESFFPPDTDREECVQICLESEQDVLAREIANASELKYITERLTVFSTNEPEMRTLALLEEQEEQWQQLRHALLLGGLGYREFAQILQLQNLIDRANVQLQQILNGYHLSILTTEDGHPTLDFNIAKGSEKERPITTLSGGESFSIALAFALALGNLRKMHMPIQTLLIDEGFGNLDHQSADMVIAGLEALKKRNIQVGLISHVLPLQERIAARVSVAELKTNAKFTAVQDAIAMKEMNVEEKKKKEKKTHSQNTAENYSQISSAEIVFKEE